MKFNKCKLALVIAFITALTVGCSSGTKTSQGNPTVNSQTAQGQRVALPEEGPALIGKVKEIVGNEVTVFKGELSQSQGAEGQQPANRSQAQTQTQAQANQGQRPQNRGMAMQFTGETETFLIPVGTSIVTMQRGTSGANQVGLTEIKKDSILRIWKKDDTVSFVQVMGGNIQRGTGQGTGGNRQGTGAGGGGGFMPGMGGAPPAGGGNR